MSTIKPHQPQIKAASSQQGFSLVEMMIAITLSLMIMGAVLEVYVSSKQTYRLTDDLSRIQENGRFSLDFLSRSIRMGGYSNLDKDKEQSALYDLACGDFDPCTANGAGTDNDRIAITINPPTPAGGVETDCTGAAIGTNDLIANVYYVTTTDEINSLVCRGFNINTGQWVSNEQPLIDGIDSLQFLYGLDTSANESGVTRFVSADEVTNQLAWGSVKAVRVGLLVGSGLETGSADEMARSYALLDSPTLTLTDRHSRQIYTATITLNNLMGTGGSL